MRFWRTCLLLGIGCGLPVALRGQTAQEWTRALVRPTSDAADRIRLAQLAGDTSLVDVFLVRSPSLLLARDTAFAALSFLRPNATLITNSAIPFGPNTGVLWAQRGPSWLVSSGVTLQAGHLRAIIAPELWFSSNRDVQFTRRYGPGIDPVIPETRWGNGYANPWYVAPYSADVPWRNGDRSLMKLWAGQSGVWYDAGRVELGATTESMWWGPGIQNGIVMSDNAAGAPRLELRTPRPIRTRAGALSARWFVGALYESQYFDTVFTNNRRSLAGLALTWRPAVQPNLTLGVERTVFATATRYREIPFRWFDVFASTGRPANRPPSDSSLTPGGRDQLLGVFGRWIFPADGFEVYSEWVRQELPTSLRDFIVAPTRSQGYTVGLQYRQPVPLDRSAFRLQFEATNLEPPGSLRTEPVGVFYTSRRVIQGYTQSGKVIGAAIGPGASSQWLALDRVWPAGSVGVTFNRIRWDEGVRAARVWPDYLGDCNQDVSIIPGIRGGHALGTGYLSADLRVATRFNYHFHNYTGCFGSARDDVRNTTLSVSFSPFRR